MIKVAVFRDGKTFNGEIDIDGDIFSKHPIIEDSYKVESMETDDFFYVTQMIDLFSCCEEVRIEKIK